MQHLAINCTMTSKRQQQKNMTENNNTLHSYFQVTYGGSIVGSDPASSLCYIKCLTEVLNLALELKIHITIL